MTKFEVKKPVKVEKGWGYELHIHNDDGYCGKVLHFNKAAKFSMHFHLMKHETWYVASGKFILFTINTETAEKQEHELVVGDVIVVPMGLPHQLFALEEGDIFEVSNPDHVIDSYRVAKGDSQNG